MFPTSFGPRVETTFSTRPTTTSSDAQVCHSRLEPTATSTRHSAAEPKRTIATIRGRTRFIRASDLSSGAGRTWRLLGQFLEFLDELWLRALEREPWVGGSEHFFVGQLFQEQQRLVLFLEDRQIVSRRRF